MNYCLADIVVPEWLASIVAGAVCTASMALTGYLVKRVSDTRASVTATDQRVAALEIHVNKLVVLEAPALGKSVENLDRRMQHLEDRLGTNPPFHA